MKDFNNTKPYNGLPLLPPKTILETAKVLRKTNDASRALAQLNGMLTNLPNPTLLLDTIHLQKAKASSEKENIITTNNDLYKSLVGDKSLIIQLRKMVSVIKKRFIMDCEILKSVLYNYKLVYRNCTKH
jgi:Fic family protein